MEEDKNLKQIVVIPAYEPDEKMIPLLKELKNSGFLIIVVNDGSNFKFDNIFKEAENYSVVLKHKENKGKGTALKTAFSYIKQNYNDYLVVTFDCDGQHSPSDAIKLCNYLLNNPSDLVIGKRIRTDKTPLKSRIGNAITRFIYRLSTGLDIYDTQTGLRAFTYKLMDFMIEIKGERFEYEMNVLLMCSKHHINIKELEIKTIYFDDNANSHFNPVKDSLTIYKQIFKFSLMSLTSFVVDYILYVIFNLIFNIYVSNVLARLISSSINYNLNSSVVFKEKNKNSLAKYYLLVIAILVLNTCILSLFVNCLYINKFIAKIITEVILFIISFTIQKYLIFKKDAL